MADPVKFRTTALDRALLHIAPKWALSRIRSRAAAVTLARHYEAAATGRRTSSWSKMTTDANLAAGAALSSLRSISRDLVRNNGWACNGKRVVTRNVVGYGITPKVDGLANAQAFRDAWRAWAESTQCDAAGRLTFAGLQKLIMSGIFEGGEMLIRRRWRRPTDGLAIPMQFQVLEPDYLDTSKNNIPGVEGGQIIYGVEFDAIGRRVAYWLFDRHPGSAYAAGVSKRYPASEIIHTFDLERAGQDRGVPWLAPAIVKLKDFDEFEDATLVRQKVAACFAAFYTDAQGDSVQFGDVDASSTAAAPLEMIEPGSIVRTPAGMDVKFPNPPSTTDDGFSARTLRGIAASLGVTYEDLTGDYSQVNFSSSRMSRIGHWGNVYDWQYNMLIPQACAPMFRWSLEAAAFGGLLDVSEVQSARVSWTPMPMPLTDPDKEARANVIRIRSGQASLSGVLREQGLDPDEHLDEYASDLKKLDDRGIWLDSDVRRVSQAGLTQERVGLSGKASGSDGGAGGAPASADGEDPAEETAEEPAE